MEGVKNTTVMRVDDWTMIPPHEGEFLQKEKNVELGKMPVPQLYDLTQDIGQITNLAEEDPDRVAAMQARLAAIKASAATRPGYASAG